MSEQTYDEWPAQWLRGALPLCVLHTVAAHGPVHGYGIASRLATAGLGTIGGGTLYPLLARLERDHLVTTSWVQGDSGPAKKVYTLTEAGAGQLKDESARWRHFSTLTSALLNTHDEESRHAGSNNE